MKKSTIEIVDIHTNKVLETLHLFKGQTYSIPKGYLVVRREDVERCYIEQEI